MKRALQNATALAVAFFFSGVAAAADIAAGEKRAAVCEACHGTLGNSANPAVPSIAGQPAQFISTSLYMFREGYRKNPEMVPIVEKLPNAAMNDLAAYFAAQKPVPARHETKPENAVAGAALVQKYSCFQCHGTRLLGQQHIPRLAGQQYQYLRAQLQAFKKGGRQDLDGKMSESLQPVPDAELEVLADYLAGLGIP